MGSEEALETRLEVLAAQLKDQDLAVRTNAIHKIWERGKNAATIVHAVADALRDDCTVVRAFAIRALEKMEELAEPVLPALYEAASGDSDKANRLVAGNAIKTINEKAGRELDAVQLVKMLGDDQAVNMFTVIQLGGIQERDLERVFRELSEAIGRGEVTHAQATVAVDIITSRMNIRGTDPGVRLRPRPQSHNRDRVRNIKGL